MTAAGTANFFAAEEESVGVSSYKIATDVHTVTIFVVADGRGGVSLELPTGSAEVGESEGEGGGGETTYVLDWPAGSATAVPVKVDSGSGESTEKAVSSTVGKSTALSATTTIAQSTSKSASSKSASSSTTNSAPSPSSSASSSSQLLCYDPNANSHSPCPTTSTTATPKSSKTSSSGVFNPSGATTVKSQASKLSFLPSSLDRLRNWFRSESGTYSLPLLIAGCVISLCISFWLLSMLYEEARGGKWRGANINIHDVNVPSVKKALRKYDLGGAQIEDIIASMDIHDGGREALRKYGFEEGEIEDVLAGPVIITAGHNDNNDNSTNNDNTDTDTNNNSTADVLRGTMPEPEPNTSTSTVIPLQENQPPTITIVKNSAKPFLEPRVVQKGQIQVVEGSARPWIKGKRTHSLWEGLGGEVVGEGEEGLGHVFVGREEGEGGVE